MRVHIESYKKKDSIYYGSFVVVNIDDDYNLVRLGTTKK